MRISWLYSLYLSLYTLFWLSLSAIGYRTFLFDGGRGHSLSADSYFFLAGLFWLVCGGIRSLKFRQPKHFYDPVNGSFAFAGLLLIAYSNLA